MQLSLWRWAVTYLGWVIAVAALVVMMQEQMFINAYKYEAKEAQHVNRACITAVNRMTQSHDRCNSMVDGCISHMKAEKVFRFEYQELIAKSKSE